MKPIQCFFYPRGAAHLIFQLELRIIELEARLELNSTKQQAQLRRLQAERDGRKAAHPAHVCKEDPEWDSEQDWLTRLPNALTPGTAWDEVQDPDQDPFQVMPSKLSDAMFPKGATAAPLALSDDFGQAVPLQSSDSSLPPSSEGTSDK